jgi:hypothetical protein
MSIHKFFKNLQASPAGRMGPLSNRSIVAHQAGCQAIAVWMLLPSMPTRLITRARAFKPTHPLDAGNVGDGK